MRRAHVEPELLEHIEDDAVLLPKSAQHHLATVLRLGPGAEVELFDGCGRVARGRFEPGPPAKVVDIKLSDVEPELGTLVVAQAFVRGSKLDDVVRKSTELGASRIVVFTASRSQGRPSKEEKVARLLRIAQEASRQCLRAHVPELGGFVSFDTLLDEVRGFPGVAVMGVLGAAAPLSATLAASARFPEGGMLVVVGPEGGLAPKEIERLEDAGAVAVGLGEHVLRTETAALAALAAAQTVLGRL